jgi:transposase
MSVRMLLTDAAWVAPAPILTSIKDTAGSLPESNDRQFIEAVWYLARTGLPWRDLPAEFGHGMPSTTAFTGGKPVVAGTSSGHASRPTGAFPCA